MCRGCQVESVALKAREDAVESCRFCQSKMDKIKDLNDHLKDRDEQIARYADCFRLKQLMQYSFSFTNLQQFVLVANWSRTLLPFFY